MGNHFVVIRNTFGNSHVPTAHTSTCVLIDCACDHEDGVRKRRNYNLLRQMLEIRLIRGIMLAAATCSTSIPNRKCVVVLGVGRRLFVSLSGYQALPTSIIDAYPSY